MVLVTGGTGFLGAYIIKALIEKGNAVRAIRRSPKLPSYISKDIFDKVQWVDGDVIDRAQNAFEARPAGSVIGRRRAVKHHQRNTIDTAADDVPWIPVQAR